MTDHTKFAIDVDALAQEIRRVDGESLLAAGYNELDLAEALMPFLNAAISSHIEALTKDMAVIKRVGDVIHKMTIVNMEHGPIGYDVIAEAALSALKGESA